MQGILTYLERQGFSTVESSYYNQINAWRKWYCGKSAFHSYTVYNGRKKVRCTRMTLGMAKTICEDWANLLLNEKVQIVISDNPTQAKIDRILKANKFGIRANQLVERTMALGTGAFVEYLDGDKVVIDYIRAGAIFPLSWDGDEISECAFASERVANKQQLVYLNIHAIDDHGNYVIRNQMFVRNGDMLTPTELPDGVQEEVATHSSTKRFQIITPNIANNVAFDCPLGISVYANAIDQLCGVDLVYDSYCNEFSLGKKRIFVPLSLTRSMLTESGDIMPVFDPNDTMFYAVPGDDKNIDNNKITDSNMEIRHEAHEAGLQTALDTLSHKCGLGLHRYEYKNGQVKTATEVITNQSDLYQSKVKHESILVTAISDMVYAIAELVGIKTAFDVTVNTDDSIIEDSDAERTRDLQDVRDALMSRVEYRMKWYGEDAETAAKAIAAIDAGGGALFGDE